MSIFHSDADRTLMLSLIGEAAERYRCRVLAYCLMSNHIHLTIQDLDGQLSKTLKYINGVYAQRFNLRHGRTGHLFEGRFWNSLLETDSYLATATEYVHRNPVDAGMVRVPEDYRWSSYRAFAGLATGEEFLDQGLVLGLYGDDRKLLRTQTESPRRNIAKEAELSRPLPKSVLGSEPFRRKHLGCATSEIAPTSASPVAAATLDRVVAEVSRAFAVSTSSIVASRRGVKSEARLAAIHLAATVATVPHVQIARYFSLSAPHTVSTISKRCVTAALQDPTLSRRINDLNELLSERNAA